MWDNVSTCIHTAIQNNPVLLFQSYYYYEMLQVLPTKLHQLSLDQQDDVVNLVTEFRCLLSNVPMQTTLIRHDIDV